MVDIHEFDKWGIHLPDDVSFFSGKRVHLECVTISNDMVWARTVSQAVPSMTLLCKFPMWVSSYIDVGREFTLTDFCVHSLQNIQSIESSSGDLLPILHPIPGHRGVAEAFAGLGGWSYGADLCGIKTTVLIEIDELTAQACGRTHNYPVHSIDEAISLASKLCLPERMVLCADVCDFRVHFLCSLLGINIWLASPPCQPWSKAGWQKGLLTQDGSLFASFVYATALSKPVCMNLENVPGLPDHPHFPLLMRVFGEAGWILAVSNIDQIYPLLPVMRARWMATCVSRFLPCDPKKILVAKDIQLPSLVPGVGHDNNMSKFGCMMKELQPWELSQSLPSDEAMKAMSNPDFLPLKHRNSNSMNLKPEEVIQLRITTGLRPLPNVMALQGSQHLLPTDLLREKGLHAYLLNDGTNLRFITPIEISTAMGFPHTVSLPSDFTAAWKMVGNSLAVPHAALQCLRAHYVLGTQSVFDEGIKGPLELCDLVLSTRFPITAFLTFLEDDWMTLQKIPTNQSIPESIPETIPVSDDDLDELHDIKAVSQDPYLAEDLPPTKRVCISPTWHAEVDELTIIPELSKTDFPNCGQWTVGTKQPCVGGLCFDTIGVSSSGDDQVCTCVKIVHSQGIWASGNLFPGTPSVSEAIRHFLPHAVQEQFQSIYLNQLPVLFGTIPKECPNMSIEFKPFCFLRMVQAPWLKKDLPVEVDVTWTFADLISFVACEAAVLSSNVRLLAGGKSMLPQEFVLQSQEVVFHAVIVASADSFQSDRNGESCKNAPSASEHLPAGNSDAALPAHKGLVRITTRHPKWGSVRSVTVPLTATAFEAIYELLPGCEKANPRFCVNNEVMDPQRTIGSFPDGDLDVFFDSQKPWPVVQVVRTTPFQKQGWPLETCTKNVKGPFDFKSKSCKVPLDWTVLHLVASFLELQASNLTLLVLQQGKSIDPRSFVQQVGHETIDIRVCALPGGAKNDQLTKKLAEILFKRGVPNEDKDSRASLILSKVSHSEVAAILTKNEFDAWSELKKKANEHKIRMVTSTELKDFQKKQRNDKSGPSKPSSSNVPLKRQRKANPSDVDPDQVMIDLSHFSCGNARPTPLKVAQWGPDSKGIAIASPTEAKKLLPISNLSADGLALLVLTDRTFDGVPPFTMPATDSQGHPILASGVLLNFGDVEIKYDPSVPVASLNEVPTATLEVVIQKKLVPKWSDVQNPLNYLGLQLPEIRSDKVIQSWNFRAYNDERVRVKHESATYIHGFVKIPEDQLITTLQRSGRAGVFLQVKGIDRKPDPRFGIVTMHGFTLDELVKLAKTTKDVLGIVQLGQQSTYGLRAKREHLASVRKQVSPQGIAIQEGEIPPDSSWWVLKNIRASTTCADLSKALKSLGWDASAIRPGGKFKWIVCSASEPPATHLCLNDDYVAVVPMRSKNGEAPKAASIGSVSKVKQADFSMCPEDSDTVTVATRMSALSTDLEDKLTNMINEKIMACDSKITGLHQSIETLKVEVDTATQQTQLELEVVKDQQSTIQNQLGTVESSIASSSNALMTQMQGLFQQMQSSLNNRLDSLDMTEHKRRKES